MKTKPKVEEKKVEVKKLPEIKFRSGALTATIWSNEATNKDDEKFENFSFTIERTYLDQKATKDKGENVYSHTTSMRKRDIANVDALMNRVRDYLMIDEDTETDKEE